MMRFEEYSKWEMKFLDKLDAFISAMWNGIQDWNSFGYKNVLRVLGYIFSDHITAMELNKTAVNSCIN